MPGDLDRGADLEDESKSEKRLNQRGLASLARNVSLVIIVAAVAVFVAEWFVRLPMDPAHPYAGGVSYDGGYGGGPGTGVPSEPLTPEQEAKLAEAELLWKYTVRINTFRRNDLLKQVVEHYMTCPRVDAIQVGCSK